MRELGQPTGWLDSHTPPLFIKVIINSQNIKIMRSTLRVVLDCYEATETNIGDLMLDNEVSFYEAVVLEASLEHLKKAKDLLLQRNAQALAEQPSRTFGVNDFWHKSRLVFNPVKGYELKGNVDCFFIKHDEFKQIKDIDELEEVTFTLEPGNHKGNQFDDDDGTWGIRSHNIWTLTH
jgi:hypothetical protein